jgi:hypothetical protein
MGVKSNTTGLKNKINRIKKLPEMYVNMVDAKLMKDANGIVSTFKKGLLENSLGLKPLKPKTVRRKQRQGYRHPTSPLVGLNGNNPRTYKNMLVIRRGKRKITIRPSNRKHWKSKLTLKQLYEVHELGTIIKRGKTVYRMPARPALNRAYEKWLNKRAMTDAEVISDAIHDIINKSNYRTYMAIIQKWNRKVDETI